MSTLGKLVRNQHIQAAMVSGLCIILLAVAFKRWLHVQATLLESSIPGLIFAIWEMTKDKATWLHWKRPYLCMGLMLLTTVLIVVRHVI